MFFVVTDKISEPNICVKKEIHFELQLRIINIISDMSYINRFYWLKVFIFSTHGKNATSSRLHDKGIILHIHISLCWIRESEFFPNWDWNMYLPLGCDTYCLHSKYHYIASHCKYQGFLKCVTIGVFCQSLKTGTIIQCKRTSHITSDFLTL